MYLEAAGPEPREEEIGRQVFAWIDPDLGRVFLEVWGIAHDRRRALDAQGIAKSWLARMVTTLEAKAPNIGPINHGERRAA